MNPSLRFIVNLCPRGTVAAIPRYENFFSNRHRLHQISITRPAAGRFIFLPSQPPSTRTGTKDDVTDTIETATLYERHMRSSSRSDEEPLQIEFSSVAATSDPHWYEGCRQALPARGKHSNSKTPGRISSVCRSAVAR